MAKEKHIRIKKYREWKSERKVGKITQEMG